MSYNLYTKLNVFQKVRRTAESCLKVQTSLASKTNDIFVYYIGS